MAIILAGLALMLAAIAFAARSVPGMVVLAAGLGALTDAAVPALQARVIGIAECPAYPGP